jgi:Cu(I)/Ag(I) efflux system membrane fusion protein
MNIRRFLPGLLLGLIVLLIAGGFLYWRGYRLMQLIASPGPSALAPEAKEGRKIKYWVSPMNPKFVSGKPGKDPMGMDLVPVYAEGPKPPGPSWWIPKPSSQWGSRQGR